jgi:uncharacterized protein YkwD
MTTLFPGQQLLPGQSLQSNNKLHRLIMQVDGNVVLYNRNSRALWSTNTGGLIKPRNFTMQTDGNLVLYSTDGKPHWASKTWNNPGAFLNVQDDGNLVVYRAGSKTETADNALWAAGSNDSSSADLGTQGNQGQGNLGNQVQEILNIHNKYRAEVGIPPLQWLDSLAAGAQEWANHLASTGQYQHSGAPGVGENLNVGTGFSVTQLVDSWGGEKQNYNGGTIPDCARDGNFENVGHYTQMVWRTTTHVGVASAVGNGQLYVVGRYSPEGNVVGMKPY